MGGLITPTGVAGLVPRAADVQTSRGLKEAPLSTLAVIPPQTGFASSPARGAFAARIVTPLVGRALLVAVIGLAFAGGMLATHSAETARLVDGAGGAWANLLRAMAALKMLFAGAASAAVLWRLGAPISLMRWSGYALAAAAAWAGPGLIWGLAHVVMGAALLHGGLIAMAVLLWRDPATRMRLSAIIAHRRLG